MGDTATQRVPGPRPDGALEREFVSVARDVKPPVPYLGGFRAVQVNQRVRVVEMCEHDLLSGVGEGLEKVE